MRVLSYSALAVTLLLPLVGCAGGPSSGAPPRDQNVITLAEIEATEAETAAQVIQQLRPRWMMRNRGVRTFGEGAEAYPKVITDESPPREVEFLLQIRKQTIQEIRYLDPREATFKFGTGYSAGVFLITTKR
jgi:hypothetical protein